MRDNNKSRGLGLCGVLTVVFVVLKLTHNIDWSWWWVLAPLWGGIALIIALLLILLIIKLL
jgi:hypothetical protein